jgi:hypothetical protein
VTVTSTLPRIYVAENSEVKYSFSIIDSPTTGMSVRDPNGQDARVAGFGADATMEQLADAKVTNCAISWHRTRFARQIRQVCDREGESTYSCHPGTMSLRALSAKGINI